MDPVSFEQQPKPFVQRSLEIASAAAELRKSLFDSIVFSPEPKQTVYVYRDNIKKRLKMRGIDEASKGSGDDEKLKN